MAFQCAASAFTLCDMAEIRDLLSRWLAAGVLDEPGAERIRTFEAANVPAVEKTNRPGALEALLYLGLAVLGVGAFNLVGDNWEQIESWARVLALGVPMVLMLGVGAVLSRSTEPQLERGSQAAWLLGVALFAAFLAVTFHEYGLGLSKTDERGWLLVVATATVLLAVGLWVLSPSHAQVLAIAGASLFLGQAVGGWTDDFSQEIAGSTILLAGLAGVALAEAGWFTPQWSARLFFAVLAIAGPFEAGVGDGGPLAFEFVAGLAAAGVIALGVLRGGFSLVLAGVGGAFVVMIAFIFEHFQDRLGAPLAMMISGGVLVAGVLLLAVLRRETRKPEAV